MVTPPAVSLSEVWCDVAGRRLAGLRIAPMGTCSGAPLVFLHEGLGSIAQWRDVPAALAVATGRLALVFERLGHGRSDPLIGPRPADYLEREAREVLPVVLDQAGIERAVLIGHSDGGSIALLFAAWHGARVQLVVTEAAHVFVEEETIRGIRAADAAFRAGDLSRRLRRYHGSGLEAMFGGWADIWLAPSRRGWNIEAELARVRAPVLAIQGADDPYGTPRQLASIAAGVCGPVETWLVQDCAHTPHVEARASVLARISGFVGSPT